MNISIKLPNDLRGKILTFPFIHALVKEAKKRLNEDGEEILNLHLISNKQNIDVLNLLPFNAYYHEIDDEDLKSVFTVHRGVANLKIDKTDIFISTTESFVDASIGKNLKASMSAGFHVGKNSFLLKKKFPLDEREHQSMQVFSLIRTICEDDPPSIPCVGSREVKPLYADWSESPYFVINLSLKGKEFHPEWAELINLFEHKNIVLMCDSLGPNYQEQNINEYIKTLSTKNKYKVFCYESNIDFGKMIAFSMCLVTEDSPLVQLGAYCGAEVFHLNRKESQTKFGPKFFIGEVNHFPVSKGEKDFNYAQVFDEVYKFIDLKTADPEE